MIIIVPTRSRPHNVLPLVVAFDETGAFGDGVELYFVADRDDPVFDAYAVAVHDASLITGNERRVVTLLDASHHEQLVPKLNKTAHYLCVTRQPAHIGFMGDDHRPRTRGWARKYREALDELGTGIVSCPDGYRPDDLPTQWTMTADIVTALNGRMVPAPVEHLYCDDAIRELGKAAGCYRYLDDCLIEHVHPVAGKVDADAQYDRVNSRDQYRRDRPGYRMWKRDGGLAWDAQAVVNLRTQKGTP
jgi:hypothetical protein